MVIQVFEEVALLFLVVVLSEHQSHCHFFLTRPNGLAILLHHPDDFQGQWSFQDMIDVPHQQRSIILPFFFAQPLALEPRPHFLLRSDLSDSFFHEVKSLLLAGRCLLRGGNGSGERTVEPLGAQVEAFPFGFLHGSTGATDQVLELKRRVFEEIAEGIIDLSVEQAAGQRKVGYYLHLICDQKLQASTKAPLQVITTRCLQLLKSNRKLLRLMVNRSLIFYDALTQNRNVISYKKQITQMAEVESCRDSAKRSRRFSEMTATTKFTRSTFDDLQVERGRRRVSFDDPRELGVSSSSEIRIMEAKCNFKLSTEVLSFEMQEQRSNQLRIIRASPQLLSYYNCLKKLFMILYQASIPIRQNRYNLCPDLLSSNNLQILAVLFDRDSNDYDPPYLRSLTTFSDNMSLLSSTSQEFQRRIEMVAIKSCLHNEKRRKIENAFLNTKIEAYWQSIEEKFSHLEIYSYIEDQFQQAEERLCFIEIQQFVKSKLCTQSFGANLRKYCRLEEIDHDMNFSFKFQFFMTEELCFNSLNDLFKEEQERPTSICQIM